MPDINLKAVECLPVMTTGMENENAIFGESPVSEKSPVCGNDVVKLQMAGELLFQGLTKYAVSRILNIHPDDI